MHLKMSQRGQKEAGQTRKDGSEKGAIDKKSKPAEPRLPRRLGRDHDYAQRVPSRKL